MPTSPTPPNVKPLSKPGSFSVSLPVRLLNSGLFVLLYHPRLFAWTLIPESLISPKKGHDMGYWYYYPWSVLRRNLGRAKENTCSGKATRKGLDKEEGLEKRCRHRHRL